MNADGLLAQSNTLIGNNLYSYCENNPINKVDYNGNLPIWYGLMNAISSIGNWIKDNIDKQVRITTKADTSVDLKVITVTKGVKTTKSKKTNKKIISYSDVMEKSVGITTNNDKANIDISISHEGVSSAASIKTKYGEYSLGSTLSLIDTSGMVSFKGIDSDIENYLIIDVNKINILGIVFAKEGIQSFRNLSNWQSQPTY